jgi:hypothetical protein
VERKKGIKIGDKDRKGIGEKEGNMDWREGQEKGIVEKEGNRNLREG